MAKETKHDRAMTIAIPTAVAMLLPELVGEAVGLVV